MFISESAKFENLDQFNWYTYDGKTRKLAARKHERDLEKGAVFGMKAIRGDKFYIIFPEDFHIDFVVTKRVGQNIINSSKVKRKPPVIENNKGTGGRAKRTLGAKGKNRVRQIEARYSWDATYFKPQNRVPDELKQGINFENYQWRKLNVVTPIRKRNGTKVIHTFAKNDIVGMRYLRDSKGGKLVTTDGKVFALGKEQYDMVLNAGRIVPKNKWPEGSITLQEMKENAEYEKEAEAQRKAERRNAEKAAAQAERREKRQRLRDERKAAREAEKEERLRLKRRLEGTKKPVEIEMKPKTDKELADMLTEGKKPKEDEDVLSEQDLQENLDSLKNMDLDSEDLQDFDDEDEDGEPIDDDLADDEMPDPEDRPINDDESDKLMENLDELIEQRHESSFDLGMDDEDPDFDADDEDEDDEVDDELEEEDDEDLEGSDPDFDDDEDLEGDEDPDEEDEDFVDGDDELEEDDPDAEEPDGEDVDGDSESEGDDVEGDDSDAEDEDEDFTDGDEDADSDEEESGDEDDEDFTDGEPDESDIDAEMAEDALDTEDGIDDEDAQAAEDELGDEPEEEDDTFDGVDEDEEPEEESEPDPDANPEGYEAEEGDVVVFRSDETQKREWVLLDIYPLPSNANIDVYKVYDISNKPDEFNTVRVSKGSRNKFENMVKFERKMNPKEFTKYFQEAEFMDRSKSPINS